MTIHDESHLYYLLDQESNLEKTSTVSLLIKRLSSSRCSWFKKMCLVTFMLYLCVKWIDVQNGSQHSFHIQLDWNPLRTSCGNNSLSFLIKQCRAFFPLRELPWWSSLILQQSTCTALSWPSATLATSRDNSSWHTQASFCKFQIGEKLFVVVHASCQQIKFNVVQ